jgi:hypothetical protein
MPFKKVIFFNMDIILKRILIIACIGAKKLDSDARVKLWSTLCPLDRIHAAHPELNVSSDNLRLEIFEEKDSMLLGGVLRYFLLELPECLLTFDFYDLVETFFVDGWYLILCINDKQIIHIIILG